MIDNIPQIAQIPVTVMQKAYAFGETAGVLHLCAWWNSVAPVSRRGADHFAVYCQSRGGLCKSIDPDDWATRSKDQFVSAGSSAYSGRIILEFCKSLIEDNSILSLNVAGTLITGTELNAGADIFPILSGRYLKRISHVALQAPVDSSPLAA